MAFHWENGLAHRLFASIYAASAVDVCFQQKRNKDEAAVAAAERRVVTLDAKYDPGNLQDKR